MPGEEYLTRDKASPTDPIQAMIDNIVGLIGVSNWTFRRFTRADDSEQASPTTADRGLYRGVEKRAEPPRDPAKAGPWIASVSDSSRPYSNGFALHFADDREQFGILTLLREDALGPFTSSEIRMLTFALDAASDRFSELRLMESQDAQLQGFRREDIDVGELDAAEDAAAHYVLDRDFRIVLAWTSENERRAAVTRLQVPLQNRLPLVLQEAVRRLTMSWTEQSASQLTGVARPVPFLVVRTRPLNGPAGLFIGVTIERSRPSRSLASAASRFGISPREVQVLALLLDGLDLAEVAERLHITSSTVQDHIKRLLTKTESHNRAEMAAKILGWAPDQARVTATDVSPSTIRTRLQRLVQVPSRESAARVR
jgi:DNA-binding CsgD family transcriptional regulator